ncbi:hypothetical protein AALP_AA3G069700 [Arabis alpina]|uniref:Importin N-terminal domain-containing protein n=1 Tax=Arabis alpina TaxID=50452 RepID=A0A087H7K0_ARAAL|nr:hypothetical protein AALP_AA3G069700 [Arabis alpina]
MAIQPIDVAVLDATIYAAKFREENERAAANNILRDLIANPDTWLQVRHILTTTSSMHTKFFALEVLEGAIKHRWNALRDEQRRAVNGYYISALIDQLPNDEASFRSERLYVNKLNVILVQILKQGPLENLTTFIRNLLHRNTFNDISTENCMAILKLLSEMVFDFSSREMTEQNRNELKELLTRDSHRIHGFFVNVFSAPQRRPELTCSTLSALRAYLPWIPFAHIVDTFLLDTLLQLFRVEEYRNLALQCLSELAALSPHGDLHNLLFVNLYTGVIRELQAIIPLGNTDFAATYLTGTSEYQTFIQNVARFFTSFFKSHIKILETDPEHMSSPLFTGFKYLIQISYVDDYHVFKICIEYWNSFVLELRGSHHEAPSLFGLMVNYLDISRGRTKRRKLYFHRMSELRLLMLNRMTKPEEAITAEDENENTLQLQYNVMRKTLINLFHLDPDDTKQHMLSMLSKFLSTEEHQLDNLNSLCYAIGSISGTMGAEEENEFLETVLIDLCRVCRKFDTNSNKVIIATNIMYIATQYLNYLKDNWMVLKSIVIMLLEYLRNPNHGLKDMACSTLLKIAQECNREFVIVKRGERWAYLSEIIENLATTIKDLGPHHLQKFYQSIGCMIQAETDPQRRTDYLEKLMYLPNKEWAEIVTEAQESADILTDQDTLSSLLVILQINTGVSSSLGSYFLSQFSRIFADMLKVYRMCSVLVSNDIADPLREELRSVKREILKVIETFGDRVLIRLTSEERQLVMDLLNWAVQSNVGEEAQFNLNLLTEMLQV